MAITKSAKKAQRQSERKRRHNLISKGKIKKLEKEIGLFLSQKKIAEAKKLLPKMYKALDKAAKRGTIKKNKASRKKSRISKLLNLRD
jgi:small subunit ribosomal protein S20